MLKVLKWLSDVGTLEEFADGKPLKEVIGYSERQHFYTRKFSGAMKSAQRREHSPNETSWMEIHLESDVIEEAQPNLSGPLPTVSLSHDTTIYFTDLELLEYLVITSAF